ncbi:MAG: TetR/AcrR family transcriptional regulator [bacterium]
MSRPMTIRNEAILEAARKVFLKHGYQASTASVAREAGVSEGSVFKHFKSKCELFAAAMGAETRIEEYEDKLMQSAGTGEVRQNLKQAAGHLLKHLQTVLPRVIMLHTSGAPMVRPCRSETRPASVQHMRVVAAYFRKEMKLGRLLMDSPEMRAHLLVGALSHYVLSDLLFDYRSGSPSAYLRTLIEAVLPDSVFPAQKAKGRRSRCVRS